MENIRVSSKDNKPASPRRAMTFARNLVIGISTSTCSINDLCLMDRVRTDGFQAKVTCARVGSECSLLMVSQRQKPELVREISLTSGNRGRQHGHRCIPSKYDMRVSWCRALTFGRRLEERIPATKAILLNGTNRSRQCENELRFKRR